MKKFSLINLMLIVLVAALSVALLTERNRPLEIEIGSFSWNVSQRALKASPSWNVENEDPPLSAQDALRISDDIASNLNTETKQLDIGMWVSDSISLVRTNSPYSNDRSKWCYLVPFRGVRLSGHEGPPHEVSLIILMDGTVLVGGTKYDDEQYIVAAIKNVYPDPKD